MTLFSLLFIVFIGWLLFRHFSKKGGVQKTEITEGENPLNWLRNIIAFQTVQEGLFIGAVNGAAGFFRPNKEKIVEYVERMEKIYSDILWQLKQHQGINLEKDYPWISEGYIAKYITQGIKNNQEWIKSIKMAAELGSSSAIRDFLWELERNIRTNKSILERRLNELKKIYS